MAAIVYHAEDGSLCCGTKICCCAANGSETCSCSNHGENETSDIKICGWNSDTAPAIPSSAQTLPMDTIYKAILISSRPVIDHAQLFTTPEAMRHPLAGFSGCLFRPPASGRFV